jgi:diguanylate cyclase (GGDEF)-like protein
LREAARRIKENLDRKLDFVARYGGEELVFIFPGTPKKGACIAIDKVSKAVGSAPYKVMNKKGEEILIDVSASIGVAEYKGVAEDVNGEKVINSADSCLYVLKGEEPDINGLTADRRGKIACERRMVTEEDILEYRREFQKPDKRSSLPPPVTTRR